MKKLLILASVLFMAMEVSAANADNQLMPRKEILETLIKVNNFYMKNHPDPGQGIPYYSRKKVYEANIWTRAVYFEGLMALYSIYPDNKYYDYAY